MTCRRCSNLFRKNKRTRSTDSQIDARFWQPLVRVVSMKFSEKQLAEAVVYWSRRCGQELSTETAAELMQDHSGVLGLVTRRLTKSLTKGGRTMSRTSLHPIRTAIEAQPRRFAVIYARVSSKSRKKKGFRSPHS